MKKIFISVLLIVGILSGCSAKQAATTKTNNAASKTTSEATSKSAKSVSAKKADSNTKKTTYKLPKNAVVITGKDTPSDTVKAFLGYLFFKQGDYNTYKQMFVNAKNVQSEQDIKKYISSANVKNLFPSDADSLNNLSKHLKAVHFEDKNKATVYWIADAKKAQDSKDRDIVDPRGNWNLIKKDGKWLFEN